MTSGREQHVVIPHIRVILMLLAAQYFWQLYCKTCVPPASVSDLTGHVSFREGHLSGLINCSSKLPISAISRSTGCGGGGVNNV